MRWPSARLPGRVRVLPGSVLFKISVLTKFSTFHRKPELLGRGPSRRAMPTRLIFGYIRVQEDPTSERSQP